jgi:hypothetical protein
MKTSSRRRRSIKHASGDQDKPDMGIERPVLPELLTSQEIADLQRDLRETVEWARRELQRQKASGAK